MYLNLNRTSMRLLTPAAYLLSGLVSGGIVLYWFGALVSPVKSPRPFLPIATSAELARSVQSRHLFGVSDGSISKAGSDASVDGLRLQGVASDGVSGKSFAIISVAGKPPQTFVEGQELSPGIQLLRVMGAGVELSIGGVIHTLPIESRRTPRSTGSVAPVGGTAKVLR